MNHCVPEWDATGRELDAMWDPTYSPKGKWDTGQTKRSDMAFVPQYDFEELCWEDGQLLIVMQGQNNKANGKNRSSGQSGACEMAPVSSGLQVAGMDNSMVTPGTGDLTHTQDDDLLAWLQHTSDEMADKLDIPIDGTPSTGPWTSFERLCSNTVVHHDNTKMTFNEEEPAAGSTSRSLKRDGTFSMQMIGNRNSYDHLDNPPNVLVNELLGSRTTPSTIKSNKEQIVDHSPVVPRMDMPPPQGHSGMAGPAYGPVPSVSANSMNFSNFSRPAATYKASLHSISMASGPSGAERVKQLDKVAVDTLKAESINSTNKHLKPISARREEVTFQTVPSASQNVNQNTESFSLWSDVEADISANEAVNGSSAVAGKSNGWDSSIISSTALITTGVLETVDHSDTCSSRGSEDSDGVDRNGAAQMSKRKFYDEDSEIQSKTLQSESTSTKKPATGEEISMKRRRVAENHNQSERRRRDRISEKMKALQALVPNSHKSDKASMLEEAISYIKALKNQIQMMSNRNGIYFSPMLIPHGMQPVQMAAWPHMAMGMGMGMGMNIGTAGMGMVNMNMSAGSTSVRQYAPLLPIPGSGISAVKTNPATTMDSTHTNPSHGMFVKHGFMSPAYPMMMPSQQGNQNSSACDTLPAPNVSPYKSVLQQQKQQPVQRVKVQPLGPASSHPGQQ